MFAPSDIVIVHLANPTEKFWGVLQRLDATGVVLEGINVSSFDEWMNQVSRDEPPTLGLATMFLPLFRVERMFLDEQVGAVESYRQRFKARVGQPVESYLGLEPETLRLAQGFGEPLIERPCTFVVPQITGGGHGQTTSCSPWPAFPRRSTPMPSSPPALCSFPIWCSIRWCAGPGSSPSSRGWRSAGSG